MRTRGVIALSLVLALLAGCSSGGSDRGASGSTTSTTGQTPQQLVAESRLSQLPAFKDVPWADDLKAEQDRFDASEQKGESPYGGFSDPDFTGKYTNVTNSERRTLDLDCAGCPKKTVWLFGASSAFGLGQRDDYTTASYLVRQGHDHGIDLTVRNLAVPGHTFVEEAEGLDAHLRVDKVKPDLVIFFDGFNDALASYMYASIRHGALLDPVVFDDKWVQEFLAQKKPPTIDRATSRQVAAHVAQRYADTQQVVHRTLDPLGIPVEFFMQPDGFVSKLQMEGLVKSLNSVMSTIADRRVVGDLVSAVVRDLGDRIHDLRTPMAKFDKPVFADTTHFNETGAQFLAGLMYPVIAPELR